MSHIVWGWMIGEARGFYGNVSMLEMGVVIFGECVVWLKSSYWGWDVWI